MKALIGFKAFYFFGSVSVRFRFGVYVKWPLSLDINPIEQVWDYGVDWIERQSYQL